MTDYKNEEVDIFYVLHKLKELFNRWNVLFFRGVNFVIKRWYILAVLIIAGAIYGYYKDNYTESENTSSVIVRINFDSVNYVYTTIELLNKKIEQKDSLFLDEMGYPTAPDEIKGFEIKPIININDIFDQYEASDRNFEATIRNIEFSTGDEEIEVSETFTQEYKYHTLDFVLTSLATEESIQKIIRYLNNNEKLQELKNVNNRDIKKHVEYSKKTIEQIDQVIDTYSSNESLNSPSEQIYIVDKNFSISPLIEKKSDLQREIEELNRYLVLSKDIVVMVNKPIIVESSETLVGNKMVYYPIIYVVIFLILALLRSTYIHLKQKAEETEASESVQ